MTNVEYLILGYGYTARFLKELIVKEEPDATVVCTSRKGDPHLPFSLSDKSTWSYLPEALVCYWTFPPEPYALVEQFFKENEGRFRKMIVIGSTSAFKVSEKDQVVDEKTEFDVTIERVKAEKYLLKKSAHLVMSSGIYGPGRNPINWVKGGQVGKNKKYVNMIHGEDLAQFLFNAAQKGENGKTYIASDNNPQTWESIIQKWEEKGLVSDVPEKASARSSKRIDSSQSIADLGIVLKHPDFTESVPTLNT